MSDRQPKVLDCTLRDGGYYNDWDFSQDLAKDLLLGLDAAGVDIVELGYRSRAASGFYGLFRYCDESLLRPLLPPAPRAEYAFMLDAKEFARDASHADVDSMRKAISPASESLFKWCRVATHPPTIEAAREQVELLKEWGYRVALNIMGISKLEGDALSGAIERANTPAMDVLYLADSYGSLTPETTLAKIHAMRAAFDGPIGVHMHENEGLALANTIAAIEDGVDYVDATLAGMGRGAGNLRLEQLLLTMFFRFGREELRPAAVLPALRRHMLPLQAQYGWGWDFSYMLSGLVEIHPTYCQQLKTGARYTLEDVAAILQDIPADKRGKYSETELLAAVGRYAERKRTSDGEVDVKETYEPPQSETVLIVANGPHLHNHQDALRRFIELHRPLVIECNDVVPLDGVQRTTVVINRVRMEELASRPGAVDPARVIVTGLKSAPAALNGQKVLGATYSLGAGSFAVEDDTMVLPGYVVGMLATGLALRANPRKIYLAGFDGFDTPDRRAEQAEMDTFWELLRRSKRAAGVELTSLLPTTYQVPVRSIYSLL